MDVANFRWICGFTVEVASFSFANEKVRKKTAIITMMNRVFGQRMAINNRMMIRNFQSSSKRMNNIFGSPKEGVYSNLPFDVKRKFIPFSVYYWGTLGFFFSFPFLSTLWHLKKSGSI